ncbi:MAG: hypothetical protein FWH29_07440 [Methanobrevibacter sp.]|nr:hypothetical protein [Methanobrevibacter sp.]
MGLFDFLKERYSKYNVNFIYSEEIDGVTYKIFSTDTQDSAKNFFESVSLEKLFKFRYIVVTETPQSICMWERGVISSMPGNLELLKGGLLRTIHAFGILHDIQ